MKWESYKVDVPPGELGDVVVERHEVTEDEARFGAMRAAIHGSRRYVPAGVYTGLKIKNSLVMSDTRDEILDHLEPIRYASGRCLVNGLGLGVVVNGMLMNSDVEDVTVVEINSDVISLVGPHWKDRYGDRLTVIHCDAFSFTPPKGERYGMVWHDIWGGICSDNLPEMHKLHRKYGRRCDRQGSWCRAECERHKRESVLC